ncbi:hypothetical protein GCM10020218_086670 [Dactylosporangium vinaceum]
MAFGAYEAVRQRGLRVPDDVSVVGFDDLPESRWASPPLTTVRQPLAEMGLLAARTVLRLAHGRDDRDAAGRAGHRADRPRQHRRTADGVTGAQNLRRRRRPRRERGRG